MNKFLILTAVLGVMLATASGVFAVPQPITVIIGEDIEVDIFPEEVDFGTVQPGTNDNPATNGPIMFDATDSNVNVNIEVTDVTGFPFETGLMLDGAPAFGQEWDLLCMFVEESETCSYETASTVPTLNVPISAPAGTANGMIEYTITGSPPGE